MPDFESLDSQQMQANIAEVNARAKLDELRAQELQCRIDQMRNNEPRYLEAATLATSLHRQPWDSFVCVMGFACAAALIIAGHAIHGWAIALIAILADQLPDLVRQWKTGQ